MPIINGWHVLAHPLFLDQFEKLIGAVERERARNPDGYGNTANAKLLTALARLLLDIVPADPTRPEYRQGGTLGSERRHWFRAKFGGQRFRLFFRYQTTGRIIIFAWVNDAETLRTYGSRTDAYAVFRTMLDRNRPPDSWAALMAEARAASARFDARIEAAEKAARKDD